MEVPFLDSLNFNASKLRVGLSQTPFAMIEILQKSGVITGYSASLIEAALGFAATVFAWVRLEKQVDTASDEFEKRG